MFKGCLRALFTGAILSIPQLAAASTSMAILDFAQTGGSGTPKHRLLISDAYVVTQDGEDRMLSRYDLKNRTLLMIDHQQQSFSSISKETAAEFAQQLKDQIAKILEQIEALPPEKQAATRAGLERLIGKGYNDDGVLEAANFSPTGDAGQFAGVQCQWFNYSEGDRSGRACLAEPKELDGGEQLLAMLRTLSEIYTIVKDGQHDEYQLALPNNPMAPMARLGKLAIRIAESNSKSTREVELLSVERAPAGEASFAIPSGFTALP
ncbi:MAG: hypothetical protein AB8B81_05050 [Halioglobus sp.]